MGKLSTSVKYYLTGLGVIIVVPVVLIMLYEWLAGGVLNGTAGSWRKEIINPNFLLSFVNPVVLLVGYGLLFYLFRQHAKEKTANRFFASLVLVLATIVVLIGVFWKVLTT